MEAISKKVRNTTNIVLPMPDGQQLKPGVVTRVDRWNFKESNDTVRGWVGSGALEIMDDLDPPERPANASETGPARLFMTEPAEEGDEEGTASDSAEGDGAATSREGARRTRTKRARRGR